MRFLSVASTGVAAACLLAVLAAGSTRADASEWRLVEGSEVRFRCVGPNVTDPAKGRFSAVSSRLQVDPEDLSSARASLSVLLGSIRTDDETWDTLFRAAPFLDIPEHPRATFEVERVRGASTLTPNRWVDVQLDGQFTLHGIRRAETSPAQVRWNPDEGILEVKAWLRFLWDEHEIWIPSGAADRIAGRGARVAILLRFEAD